MATTQQGVSPSVKPQPSTEPDFLALADEHEPGDVITDYSREISAALSKATDEEFDVAWIQGQSCTGCTISLLQGEYPDVEEQLSTFRESISFHPTLMTDAGENALDGLGPDLDVLIVEGSIPTTVPRAATLGVDHEGNRRPVLDWVMELGQRADVVIGVGSCAAFGGLPAAGKNDKPSVGSGPTGAKGLQFEGQDAGGVFGPDFETGAELPVINIPGCPAHPDHVLLTLATVLNGHDPILDEYNRPMPLFEPLVHDDCDLRDDYECGEFASEPGEDGCLYDAGCAGVYAHCDCTDRLRNGETAICRDVGAPCIGCVEPGFWDRFTPFYSTGQTRSAPSDPSPIDAATEMTPNTEMGAFGYLFAIPMLLFSLLFAPVFGVVSLVQHLFGSDEPISWSN
jgi:hydrogenase small subunit